MLIGALCLLVFLIMALAMYGRRLSALLALPLMAVAIALIGGIGPEDIVNNVLAKGTLKLHNAYTTTMFGAMLAELLNKLGMARALVRWVAEFAGDSPYLLGLLLTIVTALLFSTLGGLGAVIMVGTIILPVMLSLGIPAHAAAALFLFAISLGGMFNLSNWQLYSEVLHIEQSQIIAFVVPFSLIVCLVILVLLLVELKDRRNIKFFTAGLLLLALSYPVLNTFAPAQKGEAHIHISDTSFIVAAAIIVLLGCYAGFRHWKKSSTLPGIALFTPLVPLVFVLAFHWEIIPAFILGITYGVLASWKHDSINVLTRSIIDGATMVIPAVLLMMGIGMLITAVTDPHVADAIAPILKVCVPTHALSYIFGFGCFSFLALYRGPLSLWGMGSGLVTLAQSVTALSTQGIMAMLMSVGQVQGICDPTNTANIWIATYLGVDTQVILKRTIPYALLSVFLGLTLAVIKGFVPW
jgi:Na+/H+ antiporter NhaD/arsenite permease-like protein